MESDSYIKPFFVIEWIQNVLSTWKYIWSPPVSRNFLNPCWRFYFTSQSGLHYCHVTLCYMLLRAVGSCCAKSETGQTFEPTTHIISFVLWSPKRSQFTWITRCLLGVYRVLWVVSFPRRTPGPSNVASVCT